MIPVTPKTGQHVKIVFRNGTVTEGIVREWYNNVVQLKALDGESDLIITNPEQDIMLIKVWDEKAPEEEAEEPELAVEDPSPVPESQWDQAVENHDPNKPDDRKTLAELKIELAKQERKIIAEKLRDHVPSAYKPSQVPYHYLPGIPAPKRSAYQPGRIPNGPRPTKKPRSQ